MTTYTHQHPSVGHLMPRFELKATDGQMIATSDYRGLRNLVLVLVGHTDNGRRQELLSRLANSYPEFAEQQTEILAIVSDPADPLRTTRQKGLVPFRVLLDEQGQAHQALARQDGESEKGPVIYVTDRYGEVYAIYRVDQGQPPPSPDKILSWVQFLQIQCPENGAPEWLMRT